MNTIFPRYSTKSINVIMLAVKLLGIMTIIQGCDMMDTETKKDDKQIVIRGEPMAEEFSIPDPIPEFPNYYYASGILKGIPSDIQSSKDMVLIGKVLNFNKVDDDIYFQLIENPVDENDVPLDPVIHFYQQTDNIVLEIDENDFVELDEPDRIAGQFGTFRIEKETYKGTPISILYIGDKREQPVYMINAAIEIEQGILYSIWEGVETRKDGLYIAKPDGRTPTRIADKGQLF